MLVKSGLQFADRLGIKTYVMSEPAGLKLYLRLGFKLVETVSTDYSQYGGTEPTVEYFLIREASPDPAYVNRPMATMASE